MSFGKCTLRCWLLNLKKKLDVHTKKDRLSQDWNSNKIHFAFFRYNEKNLIPASYALRILETKRWEKWNHAASSFYWALSSIKYSSIAQNQKALIVHLDFPSTDGRVRQWPFVKLKLAAESNLYSNLNSRAEQAPPLHIQPVLYTRGSCESTFSDLHRSF